MTIPSKINPLGISEAYIQEGLLSFWDGYSLVPSSYIWPDISGNNYNGKIGNNFSIGSSVNWGSNYIDITTTDGKNGNTYGIVESPAISLPTATEFTAEILFSYNVVPTAGNQIISGIKFSKSGPLSQLLIGYQRYLGFNCYSFDRYTTIQLTAGEIVHICITCKDNNVKLYINNNLLLNADNTISLRYTSPYYIQLASTPVSMKTYLMRTYKRELSFEELTSNYYIDKFRYHI